VRIYVGTTLVALRELLDHGSLAVGSTAHAVTPTLRESFAEADAEELEYAALADAARDSLQALADVPEAPRRRVVVVADLPDSAGTPTAGLRSGVTVTGGVSLSDVAAVHVDDEAAESTIVAAVGALGAALAGDDDAAFLVDEAGGWELMWFATQEIGDLLA